MTPVRVAWAGILSGLALSLVLASGAVGQPQPEQGRPPRVRLLLKTAIESYKRGDFETAGLYLQQVEAGKTELTLAEQQDFAKFSQQTGLALQARREGANQLRLAEEALKQKKMQDAAGLLRQVNSNQYLNPADKQALAGLNEQMRQLGISMGEAPGEAKDVRALLTGARAAMQRGDFDQAESLTAQAEKVGYSLPTWMHPWSDTPAKVRREITAARAKATPAPLAKMEGQKKEETGGPLGFVNKIFSKSEKPEMPPQVKGPETKGADFKGLDPQGPTPVGPLAKSTDNFPPIQKTSFEGGPPPFPGAKKDNFMPPVAGGPALKKDGPAANPMAGGGTDKLEARKLIAAGYQALEAGDYQRAQTMAQQAKELKSDLEWWEKNPDRLLADIARRSQGAVTANKIAPPPPGAGPAEARALVKEARSLLAQDKLEAADVKCAQAAGIKGVKWGLFEDSPDKLRADMNKARLRSDRDQAAKLLADARKLYQMGNLQEAKQKAWKSQQLHGPYSVWDLSDRPQKLLEEIQRAEAQGKKSNNQVLPEQGPVAQKKKDDRSPPSTQVAKNDGPVRTDTPKIDDRQAPPAPLSTKPLVSAATKQKALGMLVSARDLQKQGKLLEARAVALEVKQMDVPFSPDEDSPDFVLLGLAAQCDRRIQQHLQQASDHVSMTPGDAQRFQRAKSELDNARQLAQTFGMDTGRIDQKAQWLVQTAQGSNVPSPVAPPNMLGQNPPPPLPGEIKLVNNQFPVLDEAGRGRQLGLEKLDQARLELKNGNTRLAAALAEEAFQPRFGVQREAENLLRSIMAEEHNQMLLRTERSALAGLDAFSRKDYKQAAGILTAVDLKLISPGTQSRIREIMAMPEMQPNLQQASMRVPLSATPIPDLSKANVTDKSGIGSGPGNLMESVQAMEQIQYQQLKDRSLQAQRAAMDLFKRGQEMKAIETLKDYLEHVERSGLDPAKVAPLRAQVDDRLQKFRTLQAQKLIDNQQTTVSLRHDENARNNGIAKTQEEVRQLVEQYRTFAKEGKYKDAQVCVRKALELDPDNLAAQAANQIIGIQLEQMRWDRNKKDQEQYFLDQLSNEGAPSLDVRSKPVTFDREALERNKNRAGGQNGFSSQTKSPLERAIEQKLRQPSSLNFKDTPLSQVISDLSGMSGINVVADKQALEEKGISLDSPLSLAVDNIPLKSALNILLRQARLTYVIKDDVLQVTTEDQAQGRMIQKVYPVADLVVPVDNHPLSSVSNFNDALARQIASNGGAGINNMGPTPIMSPHGMPPGTPVSSYGGGLGSAMGGNQATPGNAQGQLFTPPPGRTLEELLMNLITNTVAQNSWDTVGGKGHIHYYPLGMALVVNQAQEVQEDVAALLASLRRLQDLEVAIEMKIVSVGESFFERLGMDFDVNIRTGTSRREGDLLGSNFTPFGTVNRNNDRLGIVSGLTPAGTLTPDLNIPLRSSSFDFSLPPFGGYPGTLGADGGLSLGLAFLSDIQVFMFLEAAQGDQRTNLMQAPKITVFNGQTATISVQDTQFFLLGVSLNQAGAQMFFQPQNQPIQTGVAMQVTPVVSADRRFVRLNLLPQLNNLLSPNIPLIPIQIPVPQVFEGPGTGTTTTGQPVIFQMFFQQPNFTQIQLQTTVNVPDGGTVLLGGLKALNEARNEFGPPVLSKIPYINRLFKNVAYGRETRSLMIMVTPRIIINEEEERIFLGEIPPIPRP